MPARTISGLFTLLAMMVVAAALALVMNAPSGVRGPGRAPGASDDRLEQQLTTDLRLDALREARALPSGVMGPREWAPLRREAST